MEKEKSVCASRLGEGCLVRWNEVSFINTVLPAFNLGRVSWSERPAAATAGPHVTIDQGDQ